jgi:hypothetical protein
MLQHPTIAERVLADWRNRNRTTSLVKLAERQGAERRDIWPSTIEFTFDDDTTLTITGRGRGHRVETGLP